MYILGTRYGGSCCRNIYLHAHSTPMYILQHTYSSKRPSIHLCRKKYVGGKPPKAKKKKPRKTFKQLEKERKEREAWEDQLLKQTMNVGGLMYQTLDRFKSAIPYSPGPAAYTPDVDVLKKKTTVCWGGWGGGVCRKWTHVGMRMMNIAWARFFDFINILSYLHVPFINRFTHLERTRQASLRSWSNLKTRTVPVPSISPIIITTAITRKALPSPSGGNRYARVCVCMCLNTYCFCARACYFLMRTYDMWACRIKLHITCSNRR